MWATALRKPFKPFSARGAAIVGPFHVKIVAMRFSDREAALVAQIPIKVPTRNSLAYSDKKCHLFRNRKPLSHSANPTIQTMS